MMNVSAEAFLLNRFLQLSTVGGGPSWALGSIPVIHPPMVLLVVATNLAAPDGSRLRLRPVVLVSGLGTAKRSIVTE